VYSKARNPFRLFVFVLVERVLRFGIFMCTTLLEPEKKTIQICGQIAHDLDI
jgi:hypothetical protein